MLKIHLPPTIPIDPIYVPFKTQSKILYGLNIGTGLQYSIMNNVAGFLAIRYEFLNSSSILMKGLLLSTGLTFK